MSDIVKRATREIAKPNSAMSKDVGAALMKTGVGGGAVVLLAAAIPFVNVAFLLVLMVVGGFFLYQKS